MKRVPPFTLHYFEGDSFMVYVGDMPMGAAREKIIGKNATKIAKRLVTNIAKELGAKVHEVREHCK